MSFARSTPALLLKKSFAAVTVLRWNSYSDPWISFEPLLVTRETCPPDVRPRSAFAVVVTTRNSWIESKVLRRTLVNGRSAFWSLTSTPSSVTFDWLLWAPFTEPLRISFPRRASWGSELRKVTPACSESRPAGLRALSGNWRIGRVPNDLPTEASVVFNCTVSALTVTVSVTVSRVSKTMGMVVFVLTRTSSPSIMTSAKPALCANRK